MESEAESFQKKFENFLHNSITIPRCHLVGVPALGDSLKLGAWVCLGGGFPCLFLADPLTDFPLS